MTENGFAEIERRLAAHHSELDAQRAREYEAHEELMAEFAGYARSPTAPPDVRALADWVDRGELSWDEAALHLLIERSPDGPR